VREFSRTASKLAWNVVRAEFWFESGTTSKVVSGFRRVCQGRRQVKKWGEWTYMTSADQSWAYNRVWAVETTPWGTRGTCPPPPLLTNGRTRGHREWKKQLTRNWPNCTNHHESATSTVGLIANFGNVFIKRLTNFLHVSTFLIFLFERLCLRSIIGGDTICTAATSYVTHVAPEIDHENRVVMCSQVSTLLLHLV